MDINMPPQRKTYKSKDKKWRKECVDQLDSATSLYTNDNTRKKVTTKIINQDLWEGRLNIPDMMRMINPYGIIANTTPNNIPHHPIVVPKIELLVGEEIKMPFDWNVIVGDRDGISQKMDYKKQVINEKINELLDQDYTQEEIQTQLKRYAIYLKYEWKDIREVRATKLLKHYWKALDIKSKFIEGFKDALIHGEEIYQCSIQDGEPVFEKLNPIKVHTIRSGMSNRIEDADIIVIEDHWSPGRILDTYYDKLTKEEIDRISKGYTSKHGAFDQEDFRNSFIISDQASITEGYINILETNGTRYSRNFIDNNGNPRVLRTYWSSLKKAYKVKYFDQYGDVAYRLESEEYIANPALGEELEEIWIREWWHGAKIGNDIYPVIEPMPVQYHRMSNPSKAHPGIVGEIYNTNQGTAVSMLDRMKEYQYMYDILMDRLNKALAKDVGAILELDLAKKPASWDIERWLSYMSRFGLLFVDSFKEGEAGMAQGKLAGNFNTTGRKLDTSQGNYIQQTINLIAFIKAEMSEIVGITPQRQGAVTSTETVGGIERSVNQSANTTAWLFEKHKQVKLRALSILLETAKVALKGNKKKLQNILDDFSSELFEIDGDELSENDYDVFVTSDTKTKEREQFLNQSAHAFMQNGGKLSTVMDIIFSESISEKMRKVEMAEQEQMEQAQQEQQAQIESAQQIAQQQLEQEQAKMNLEKYKIDAENATKVLIEQMRQKEADSDREAEAKKTSQEILVDIKKMQQQIELEKQKAKTKI